MVAFAAWQDIGPFQSFTERLEGSVDAGYCGEIATNRRGPNGPQYRPLRNQTIEIFAATCTNGGPSVVWYRYKGDVEYAAAKALVDPDDDQRLCVSPDRSEILLGRDVEDFVELCKSRDGI